MTIYTISFICEIYSLTMTTYWSTIPRISVLVILRPTSQEIRWIHSPDFMNSWNNCSAGSSALFRLPTAAAIPVTGLVRTGIGIRSRALRNSPIGIRKNNGMNKNARSLRDDRPNISARNVRVSISPKRKHLKTGTISFIF